MNNPTSADPAHALYPSPEGCAGWRLWRMLDDYAQGQGSGVGRRQYLGAFDRRNVLSARVWTQADANSAGRMMADVVLAERTVVVLGTSTLRALGLPRLGWGEWGQFQWLGGRIDYCLLPHPSGRCREYNDSAMRDLAGRTLWELYRASVPA